MTDATRGHPLPLPSVVVERTRFNPPGQPQLSYGGGAFLATFERMLVRLPRQTTPGPDGSPALTPFARFNVDSGDDWTLALLHAWAAVAHVLGFYHERIVNEGYLRTATERLSLVQLARTVGYEPQPGLAAGAMLAFTVVQGQGEPPQTVFVPKGTAVQSVPRPRSGHHLGRPTSDLPQVFETSDDFVARSEWNRLRPAAGDERAADFRLAPDSHSLRLLGNRSDLKKGERLLFVGRDPDDPQRTLWRMAQVTATTPNLARGFTVLTWQNSAGMPVDPLPYPGMALQPGVNVAEAPDRPALPKALVAPQVFVLRQKSGLFPYAAAGVYRTWPPEESATATEDPVGRAPERQWWPAGIGLPHESVELMVTTRAGHLLAVVKKELRRSTDGGASWQPAGAGLPARQVTALTVGDDGALYAGTDKGEVHLSQDEGETWRQAAGAPVRLPVRGLAKLVPAILRSSSHLPEVVVWSLAAYRTGSKEMLAAGTDSGVFLSTNRGQSWKTANLVLPKLDRKTGLAKVSVRALAAVQDGKRQRLYAGTDMGVYPIRPTPSATPVLLVGLVLALLYGLLNLGSVLTKVVYSAVVGFVQEAAGASAGDLLAKPNQAVDKLDLPLIGKAIADPAGKLIDNLTNSIKAFIAKFPATIPIKGSEEAARLPQPIAAILRFADTYPLLWLLVDAALIAAAIAVVLAAWWLAWRYLNNRPGRRIAGSASSAPPAPAPAMTLPNSKDLPKHPPMAVRALLAGAAALVAGTAQGVYVAAIPGPHPQHNRLQRVLTRLLQRVFPGLLAGWTHLESASVEQPDVQTLAMPSPVDVLAATQAGAIYRYRNTGGSWQPGERDESPLALTGIAATVTVPAAQFVGGAPARAKVDSQWSPWQVQSRAVDLDAVHDGIAPGSWLVLEAGSAVEDKHSAPQPRLYRVVQQERCDSRDAAKGGSFTRVTVERDEGLAQFDRSMAQALYQSEPLKLYDDAPVFGSELMLDGVAPALQPGQHVIVSGKRLRVRLVAVPGTAVTLKAASGLQTVKIQAGEELFLLPPLPRHFAAAPGEAGQARDGASATSALLSDETPTEVWHVLNRDGIVGQVELTHGPGGSAAQFELEPPREEDPEISELAVIQRVVAGAATTTLILTTDLSGLTADPTPLANIFERSTCVVRANVVRATHGSTVPAEVLGSSAGAQANQRFVLRQTPLTYISAATPEGRTSTLAITVAGVRWRQAPFLYGLPRDERAYVVQHDEHGRAIVTFGDGRSGARLPSTREEVTATYRIGIGESGNLPAGVLTQLRSAPHGLAGVTNPLPALGGVDPEPNDSIRSRAPLALRAMQRIVSVSDYEDFVRAFSGIGRAQARMFHGSQGGLLHITVAAGDGKALSPDSDLYANLVEAVERARAAPTPRFQIASYEAVYFDVAVKLLVQHSHLAQQAMIERQARQALSEIFAFQRRTFGQPVYAAEIVTLLQAIAGVVGVMIEQLAYHPGSPALTPPEVLQAQPARWQRGAVLPAQMLLINDQTADGIAVTLEFAP